MVATYNPTSTATSRPAPTNTSINTPTSTTTASPTATHTPLPTFTPAASGREVFDDLNPDTQLLELWRIEHNWGTTAKLAYHFQDPFSFDGRYIVSQQGRHLHVFDLHTNQVVKVLYGGQKPTWARHSHQVFYYRDHRVWRYDVGRDETEVIVEGVGAGYPRTISRDDLYIFTAYGGFSGGDDRSNTGELYRIENMAGASVENGGVVQLTDEWQYASEPRASSRYDVIVFKQRRDFGGIAWGWWAMRFDGSWEENRRSLKLLDEEFSLGAHAAWLGDGEHFIMGNECPPQKIRYLDDGRWGDWEPVSSSTFCAGDVAPMGYSGQWFVADEGNASYINIVDMETGRSMLLACDPSEIIDEHPGDENLGDPNPHGSPDGTKVVFVSNYDFKNYPTTQLTDRITDTVPVRSTAGFPSTGVLSVRHHLVAYTSKTPNSFEGLTIGALGTGPAVEGVGWGTVVTDFAGRSSSLTNLDHQYWQDLYVAVYRLPDMPSLSVSPGTIEITPGENHREIMGYKLHGPGGPMLVTSFPASVELAVGEYAVSAVEWSGLESPLSEGVAISASTFEIVLAGNS